MKKEQYLDTKFGTSAQPISKKFSEAIEKGTINLESEEDLDEFIRGLQSIQENELGRAASFNLLNINNGKNTIEFRVANGSINADTWIENARLYGRIVQISEKLAQIEKIKESELTDEDKKLLNLMQQLKGEKPEREKMEILLEMLFTEEERIVYRERYDENTRLMEEEAKKGNDRLGSFGFAEVVEFRQKRHSIGEFSDIANQTRRENYEVVTMETRDGVIGENTMEGNTKERGED